jgi:hypothetical protein
MIATNSFIPIHLHILQLSIGRDVMSFCISGRDLSYPSVGILLFLTFVSGLILPVLPTGQLFPSFLLSFNLFLVLFKTMTIALYHEPPF